MKDLLRALGKRVNELRTAKGWSQEEFASIGGFHRTYIGQIERGEKNISLANLVKLSNVLDVTVSDLLSRLEDGSLVGKAESQRTRKGESKGTINSDRRLLEIRRLMKRLGHQQAEVERTILALTELTAPTARVRSAERIRGR